MHSAAPAREAYPSPRADGLRAKTAALIAVAGIFCAMGGTCASPIPNPGGTPPELQAWDHVLGSADATVTVIEYTNFGCGFCGSFELHEFPTLKEQYVDTGKVRWVFRHAASSTTSQAAARSAECAADQGQFWEYKALLYAHQDELNEVGYQARASELGLDRTTFDACLASEEKQTLVETYLATAHALDIPLTPSFYVNEELVSGFQSAESLGQIIEAHLSSP